jgi:DNA-nicking Smr family endonuclease
MNQDDELFLQEMQGVERIQIQEKVTLRKTPQIGNAELRRQAAIDESHTDVVRIGPHDIVGFKRPGIQDGVFRKLRLGKYDIEARLDLHRKTIEQARQEVFRFVRDCLAADIRSVLILPGKGDRSSGDSAILKSYLAHWLEDLNDVQGYHTAQPHHGGSGAFYVLLRKSDRKKQLAREQFSKGRV